MEEKQDLVNSRGIQPIIANEMPLGSSLAEPES